MKKSIKSFLKQLKRILRIRDLHDKVPDDELANVFQVGLSTNDIVMMADELKYLPCHNINYQIYDYSVRKIDSDNLSDMDFDCFMKHKTIRRTRKPICFSKVTCNVYHDTHEFYVSCYTYTVGIDHHLWEIIITVRFVMNCITNIYDEQIRMLCTKLAHSFMIENHLDVLSKYDLKFHNSSYNKLIKNSQYDGYSKIYGNEDYHESCGYKTDVVFFDETAYVPSGISSTFVTDDKNTK